MITDVCGLLSGIAFSTDTIDDLRFALFNERSDLEEEEDSESNEDASTTTTTTTTTKPIPQSVIDQTSLVRNKRTLFCKM